MAKRIFMYLFLFTLLLVIYQYMNEKKIYEAQEAKIKILQEQKKIDTDSIKILNVKLNNFKSNDTEVVNKK